MSSSVKAECRKFSPNVFNKSKCQNCFRTRDTHSAEALESLRASRNVFKCGYLFVAPDWDFNVSVNRTKRWQRRWFVLYDDGELTYSLDQFPETIPQGTIDMNKVLEVSDAEAVTGNEFALSITTPDKIHFVKGTSKEESKWWFDVLSRVAPRHLSRGKHKRNATFPCGRVSIPTAAVIAQVTSEDDLLLNSYSRPKFLSSSELMRNEQDLISSLDVDEDEEDVFPIQEDDATSDTESKRDVRVQNTLNTLLSQADPSEGQSHQQKSAKQLNDSLSQMEELEARRRNRRYLKRENRLHRNQRSRNDGVSKMIPSKNRTENKCAGSGGDGEAAAPPSNNTNGSAIAAAEKLEYLESIHSTQTRSPIPGKEIQNTKDSSSAVSVEKTSSNKTNLRKSESLKHIPSETQTDVRDHVSGLRRHHSFKGSMAAAHRKSKSITPSSSAKKSKLHTTTALKIPTHSASATVDKVPETNIPEPPNMPSNTGSAKMEDGVFTRTGWLMRQTLSKDWSRHWFVLRDSSLTYYRDSSAEHCGIMDGILDLNQVSSIREVDSDRHCAFSLSMWDGKKHLLAAETDDFRRMWIQALHYASNLWSSASKEDFICTEIVLPEHSFHQDRISSPSSLSYVCNTETSSASSDDQSEYFSLVDEDEVSDLSSSPRTLPPSPPINRTMMSLVKEKSRIRSTCGQKVTSSHVPVHSTPLSKATDLEHLRFNHRSLSQDALDTIHHEEMDMEEFARRFMNDGSLTDFYENKKNNEYGGGSRKIRERKRSHTKDEDSLLLDHSEISKSSTPDTDENECSMCTKVKSKLVATKEQIRKLKKELADAHENFDKLEMFSYKLSQDLKIKEEHYVSQISLMTAKIDDLTSKFSLAEKNYRQLKQKAAKSEMKERKRSSLKNKEGLSLTKEYEMKLCDLEKKLNLIESAIHEESASSNAPPCSNSNSERSNTMEPSGLVTATELTSSSHQSFFSRLQSLMSRTQKVDQELSSVEVTSSQDTESPEIRLEGKYFDEPGTRDEASNDQWITTFDKSIENLNKYLEEYPTSLDDCKTAFFNKMGNIIQWLQVSLENIYTADSSKTHSTDKKFHLLQNVCNMFKLFVEPPSETNNIHLAFLKVIEMLKLFEKINGIDSVETLVKCDLTECAFKVLTKTMCLAFAEHENKEINHIFELISKIPHLNFFCSIFNKLYPQNCEESGLSVSERLQEIYDQRIFVLNLVLDAKKVRYESLWNALADVPVRDNNPNKQPKISSMQQYVTFVATDIFRIAELQLPLLQSNFLLKIENDLVSSWCLSLTRALDESLEAFLVELKEQCPMIHESTVSLRDLSDGTRMEIACCVSELSFLCVSHALMNSLFTKLSEIFETSQDSLLEPQSYKNEKIAAHSDCFRCRQCATMCNLLCKTSLPGPVNWSDYVQQYRFYKSENGQLLNYLMENGKNSSGLCSNCDNCISGSVLGKSKDACNNVTCAECDHWIKKLCSTEKQHEVERQAMDVKFEQELRLVEETLIKSSEIHKKEINQKEKELESTKKHFYRLKNEYEEQISALKQLYEQQLHLKPDSVDPDVIRQTYRSEIEDLKDMFKKGLMVIENSHQRLTTEMEMKHRNEITMLHVEKEKALQLEAQATVTALEAIKKSHELQLKEETANIREDFVKKFQNGEHNDIYCNKFGNDLTSLKNEILNMTDMYSAKCLENVELEERVTTLKQKLEGAHHELCSLLQKNKEIDFSLSHL